MCLLVHELMHKPNKLHTLFTICSALLSPELDVILCLPLLNHLLCCL